MSRQLRASVLPDEPRTACWKKRADDLDIIARFARVDEAVEENNLQGHRRPSLRYGSRIILNSDFLDRAKVAESVLTYDVCVSRKPSGRCRCPKREARVGVLGRDVAFLNSVVSDKAP